MKIADSGRQNLGDLRFLQEWNIGINNGVVYLRDVPPSLVCREWVLVAVISAGMMARLQMEISVTEGNEEFDLFERQIKNSPFIQREFFDVNFKRHSLNMADQRRCYGIFV
ncbi:hypothetical protein AVEN_143451-1 [Araneus ventricosus]|uniref:Uncharacterized protein n=1 Tax=Araneus ventricosus TaxID=182803 RepID=A0A4Y2HCM2_ARAVE|nr:hypothetical protein AVEN_143451-1 [Araneus ventricosus]